MAAQVFGINHTAIEVGDLHDESLVWLLPYREVQTVGIEFGEPKPRSDAG
jgi:hypothetical protein